MDPRLEQFLYTVDSKRITPERIADIVADAFPPDVPVKVDGRWLTVICLNLYPDSLSTTHTKCRALAVGDELLIPGAQVFRRIRGDAIYANRQSGKCDFASAATWDWFAQSRSRIGAELLAHADHISSFRQRAEAVISGYGTSPLPNSNMSTYRARAHIAHKHLTTVLQLAADALAPNAGIDALPRLVDALHDATTTLAPVESYRRVFSTLMRYHAHLTDGSRQGSAMSKRSVIGSMSNALSREAEAVAPLPDLADFTAAFENAAQSLRFVDLAARLLLDYAQYSVEIGGRPFTVVNDRAKYTADSRHGLQNTSERGNTIVFAGLRWEIFGRRSPTVDHVLRLIHDSRPIISAMREIEQRRFPGYHPLQ